MNTIRLTLVAAISLGLLGCATPPPAGLAVAPVPDDGGVSDFYVWQGPIPRRPGQLLRQEPLADRTPLANAARSVRILHTSTDGLDGRTPITVSGALYLPKGTAPAGGWPLLAWAHGTVGIADKCAPSWNGRSQRDVDYLNYWLAQGYAVVASDYQGLGTPGRHPYLATRPAAYSMLDSIRAVQRADFGLSKKVVLIGQSQGGGAAFATAGYAARYAPELDIRGTVATGTPYFSPEAQAANLAAKPRNVVDPTFGYTLLILTLMEQTDPGFRIDDYVTDRAKPVFERGYSGCLGDLAQGINQAQLTFDNTFKVDPIQRVANAYRLMGYPTLKSAAPVFMGTGGRDRDVPPGMQQSLVRDACRAGAVIEWRLYPELDHSGAVNGSRQDSTPFVRQAFAGQPIAGNCNTPPAT
jgi:pimeloyl-ACP methyl ester carboxylesterase